jgi:ribosomal-protein-alanine N-acetyltransferase
MSAVLRRATLTDAVLLAQMYRRCFDDAWDAPAFQRLLEKPGAFALLAGEAATYSQAFILIQVAADQAEILSLGTESQGRRKGLGQTLVATGAAEAFRLGARELFLEVAKDNAAALALYAGMGFQVCGWRTAYYRWRDTPPVDAAILRARLPLGGNFAHVYITAWE